MAKREEERPPKGPWSDLPPTPIKRERLFKWPKHAARGREPMVRNWRAVVIVLFLLIVAPILASWLAHMIMGMMNRGS